MRRTYLYVGYASDDTPLYAGIAYNLEERWAAHRAGKEWWAEIARFSVVTYQTREEAEEAERYEISRLVPTYNQLPGVKTKAARVLQDKLRPKTYAKLPQKELDYLKTLSSEDTYRRCKELQAAGWAVPAMLEGARVAPTLAQLSSELKYLPLVSTGVPLPVMPETEEDRREQRRHKAEREQYISDTEIDLLKHYSKVARKNRPQFGPMHPISQAVAEYEELVTMLHNRGVLFSRMADVVGITESNVRRRYIRE